VTSATGGVIFHTTPPGPQEEEVEEVCGDL